MPRQPVLNASAINHDLDAFDDWFESLDNGQKTEAHRDQSSNRRPSTKAIRIIDKAIRINSGVNDVDSSDDECDSKKGRRQNPKRGMLSRRQSGALEQMLSAPLPTTIARKQQAKSKPIEKSENIAIKLLTDHDKERAKKALAKRDDSKRINEERKRSVNDSLNQHLGPETDKLPNVNMMPSRKPCTRTSRSQYSRSRAVGHHNGSPTKTTANSLKLSDIYGNLSSFGGSTGDSNGTATTSDDSISSTSDEDHKTEVALEGKPVDDNNNCDPGSSYRHCSFDGSSAGRYEPHDIHGTRSLLSVSAHGSRVCRETRELNGRRKKDSLSSSPVDPTHTWSNPGHSLMMSKATATVRSHGPTRSQSTPESCSAQVKYAVSVSSHGPAGIRSVEGFQTRSNRVRSMTPHIPAIAGSSEENPGLGKKDALSASAHGSARSGSTAEGSSTRTKDKPSMSSHYPRRNISDAQDLVQKNRGLSLSETVHVDTRHTLSHPYNSAVARSNGNQRTWRDPLSQSCHNATPRTDDGTNGNRPRRQMYVRASSSRSMQPGPAKDCGEIGVKTNRHLPNSRESGRGKDELCFSEHRVRRPREFNRSSSNADLGERISSSVNYVDDEVKPRSNVSRSMYPPRSKSAVSGSSQ